MSYRTLDTASKDYALMNRTIACVQQQAWTNAAVAGSAFAAAVKANPAQASALIWPVALDTEAVYAAAIKANVPDPGGNETVITDEMILDAVQANWPEDVSP